MNKLVKFTLFIVLFLSVNITAKATIVSGTVTNNNIALVNGSVSFKLLGCANPLVNSSAGIAAVSSYNYKLDANGNFPFASVTGNDIIYCSGVVGTTYYELKASNAAGGLIWDRYYKITNNIWSINTATVLTNFSVNNYVLTNPAGDQIISVPTNNRLSIVGGPTLISQLQLGQDPILANDAATKNYVDNALKTAGGSSGNLDLGKVLNLTGGVMSGPIYLPGDPALPLQAADKNYVDTLVTTKQSALGYTPENIANKNLENGYAGLDSNAHLNGSFITGSVPLAALAGALNLTPLVCSGGTASIGILSNGNTAGCVSGGSGGSTSIPGLNKQVLIIGTNGNPTATLDTIDPANGNFITPGKITASSSTIALANGLYNSDSYIDATLNDGIKNVLAGPCASGGCIITVPATSVSRESYSDAPVLATTPSNTLIKDERFNPGTSPGNGTDYFGNYYHNCGSYEHYSTIAYCDHNIYLYDKPALGSTPKGVGRIFDFIANTPNAFYFGNAVSGNGNAGWSNFTGTINTYTFNSRAITAGETTTINKHAVGDLQPSYHYIFGTGGAVAASDESFNIGGSTNGGEYSGWFHATLNAGATTGATKLSVNIVSGTTSCDGCIALDITKGSIAAYQSGNATTMTNYVAAILPVVATTGTIIPSTKYGHVSPSNFQPNNITVIPSPQPEGTQGSISIDLTLDGGTGTQYNVGNACLSGANFPEQVTITNVSAPSGGHQVVTMLYSHPNNLLGSSLWQGGMCGQYLTEDVNYNRNGMHTAVNVVGSVDSTHIAVATPSHGNGNVFTGFLLLNQTAGTSPINLSRNASGVVTLTYNNPLYIPFIQQTTGIVFSGSPDTSFNGPCTNVVLNYFAGSTNISGFTCSQTGPVSSTSSYGIVISLPNSAYGFHFYPGAEDMAPLDANNNITLEPNAVNWSQGDAIEEPNPYAVDESMISENMFQFTAPDNAGSVGHLLTFEGSGITGNFSAYRIINKNPCSMYYGCAPGVTNAISAPILFNVQGQWTSFFNFTNPPTSTGAVFNISQGNSDAHPFSLFILPGGGKVDWSPSLATLNLPIIFSPTGTISNLTSNLLTAFSLKATNASFTGLDIPAAYFPSTHISLSPLTLGGPYIYGVGGNTTYTYVVVPHSANGIDTTHEATVSTNLGNATLTASNYLGVNVNFQGGATTFDVYRTVGGATTGKIATLTHGATACNPGSDCFLDTGLVGDGSVPPISSINSSGVFSINNSQNITGIQGLGANLLAASGIFTSGNVLTVDNSGNAISSSSISISDIYDSNLIPGNCLQAGPGGRITTISLPCSTGGGGSSITLQTNSVNNASQIGLNLIAGSKMVLTNSGSGVTINTKSLPLSCQPKILGGGSPIPANTYTSIDCRNESGYTWTISSISCYTDTGIGTCNVASSGGSAMLTSAITGGAPGFVNGTQTGVTTVAPLDYLKITFVSNGTPTEIYADITGSY